MIYHTFIGPKWHQHIKSSHQQIRKNDFPGKGRLPRRELFLQNVARSALPKVNRTIHL